MLVHVWWDNDIVYFCVFLRLPIDIHIDDMHVWMFIIAVNYTSILLSNALNWLGRKVMYTQVIFPGLGGYPLYIKIPISTVLICIILKI